MRVSCLWFLNSFDRDLPRSATVNLFARSGDRVAAENRDKTAQPYSVGDISDAVKKSRRWNRNGRSTSTSTTHWTTTATCASVAVTRSCPKAASTSLQFNAKAGYSSPSVTRYVPPGEAGQRVAVEAKARTNGSHWILKARHRLRASTGVGSQPPRMLLRRKDRTVRRTTGTQLQGAPSQHGRM